MIRPPTAHPHCAHGADVHAASVVASAGTFWAAAASSVSQHPPNQLGRTGHSTGRGFGSSHILETR